MRPILLSIVFLSSSFHLTAYEVIPDKTKVSVLSSDFKDRTTLKIQLENGIQAYIISDEHAENSSVALSVNTGSWEEPENTFGLAHFLEHMLFMGTTSHPDEESFGEFIKQHGGETNAYTEDLYTTYVFSIASGEFEEGLKRFSEFFKEPLLKESTSEREIQAITQEFQGNIRDDDVRRLMVYKELANPLHPWHQFSYGNYDTLHNVPQSSLRNWFLENYTPDRMKLVIYSNLPTTQLAEWVEKDFGSILLKKKKERLFLEKILSDETKNRIVYIDSLKMQRSLGLLWQLPKEIAQNVDNRPEELLCYIIGHETKNSLLDTLRKKGLALELSCGALRFDENNMLFYLEIDLTELGLANTFEVVGFVFQALDELKNEEIPSYLFDDYQAMNRLKIQYPERDSSFKEVYKLSRALRPVTLPAFPENSSLLKEFRPEELKNLLSFLTPENVRIDVQTPLKKAEKKEKWMGVKYSIEKIAPEWLEKWNHPVSQTTFALPPRNPYLAKDFTLLCDSSKKMEAPVLLQNDSLIKAYYQTDCYYLSPTVDLRLNLSTPLLNYTSSEQVALGELFVKLFEQQFAVVAYEASLANEIYEMKYSEKGIELSIQGYSSTTPLFFSTLLQAMKSFTFDESVYQNTLEAYRFELENKDKETPYKQAVEVLRESIFNSFYTNEDKLHALSHHFSYEKFKEYASNLFESLYVEALFLGNLNEEDAKKYLSTITEIFQPKEFPEKMRFRRKIGTLKEGAGPFFIEEKTTVPGNALLVAYELSEFSPEWLVTTDILSKMLADPFFHELRTKQQTAYLIANLSETVQDKILLLFVIESHTHSPRDLLARVELFIESFLQSLTDYSSSFKNVKNAYLNSLHTPPTSLKEMGKELFEEAFTWQGDFSWREKKIASLEKMDFSEFSQNVVALLGKSNKKRIAIFIRGVQDEKVLDYVEAKNPEEIRSYTTF